MNKKADVEIDKLIIFLLAIIALVAFFVFLKSSLNDLIETFFKFIKDIFK